MTSLLRGAVAGWALIPLGWAQSDLPAADNDKTPEVLIETIKQTHDPENRLKLLDVFVRTLPPNESTTWAYEQKFRIEVETARLDRALETGGTLLARDQRELEIAYECVNLARQKGDPALIRKWSEVAGSSAGWWASFPLNRVLSKEQTEGDQKNAAILAEMI